MASDMKGAGSPIAAIEDEIVPSGQLERLGPNLFSRVSEPDADGGVYTLEIFTQPLGSCSNNDLGRIAACELRIGAPVAKKTKKPLLDGKIENLWRDDRGTRLDTVRTLATLLGYVRDFCAGIEVLHISSFQEMDHPAWLREFFTITGFNRCECLKPEAGNQGYRACYKLEGSIKKTVYGTGVIESTNKEKGKNHSKAQEGKIEAKENEEVKADGPENMITRKAPTPPTSAGLTVAKPSSLQQQNRSVNPFQVDEAIVVKQKSGENPSKAATTAPQENSQYGVQSREVAESQGNMVHADEWLSQNQKILSSKTTPPASKSTEAPMPSSKEADRPKAGLGKDVQKLSAETGKRDADTAGLDGTEASDRIVKQRRERINSGSEPNTKKSYHDYNLPSKPSTPSNQPSQPTARYSFTMANPQTPSTTSEGRSGDRSIMDALLAQVDRSTAKRSPEQVKKEPTSSRLPSSPPPEKDRQRSVDLPPTKLTCYYWKHQGGCSKPDWLCQYAHWDTGHDASAPNRYKSKRHYSSYYGQYDGAEDPYMDLPYTEESRNTYKDLDAPKGPRADTEGVSNREKRIKRIDSYHPEP